MLAAWWSAVVGNRHPLLLAAGRRPAGAPGCRLVALATAVLAVGCQHTIDRALVPDPRAALATAGGSFEAHVERIHVGWWEGGGTKVDIRIRNASPRKLRLLTERVRLAALEPAGMPPASLPAAGPVAVGSPVEGAIAGARLGSSLSLGSGRTGGVAGGAAGAVAGAGLTAGALTPVLVYVIIDRAIEEARKNLGPGEAATYAFDLGAERLDSGRRYVLVLDDALGLAPGTIAPLPLCQVELPHAGYGPPSALEWILVGRVGGGSIHEGTSTGAVGGLELFLGPQWGRLAVGAHLMLGAGSVGGEVRFHLALTRWLSLVPSVSYDYYFLAGVFGFGVGHGPRGGLEVQFPFGWLTRMGWSRPGVFVGLYGQAGPVFLRERDGVGREMQFGLTFAFF